VAGGRSFVRETFFAIVNPAAGGGRSGKLAGPAIARLREHGLHVDVIASTGPGHASELAREAYAQNYRRFIAVGGGRHRPTKSSTASSPTLEPMPESLSAFFPSAPAIPSYAISQRKTVPKSRCKP